MNFLNIHKKIASGVVNSATAVGGAVVGVGGAISGKKSVAAADDESSDSEEAVDISKSQRSKKQVKPTPTASLTQVAGPAPATTPPQSRTPEKEQKSQMGNTKKGSGSKDTASTPAPACTGDSRVTTVTSAATSTVTTLSTAERMENSQEKTPDIDKDEMKHELRGCTYYHGFLPRKDAEDLLAKKNEFLLRKSDRPGVGFTVLLSLRMEDRQEGEELPPAGVDIPRSRRVVDHMIVVRDNHAKKWAIRENEWFDSISDLLTYYAINQTPLIEDDPRYLIRFPIPRMNYLLRHSQVIRDKKIGAGAFGEVFKGKLKIDEERSWDVAIKCLPEGMIVSKEQRDNFVAEARICKKLNHTNIIRLRGVAIDEWPLMMVLEWAENGSMLDVLRKRSGEITLVDKELMLVHAANGMRYLEKHNVIHRDVAARNCLIDRDMIVKIADFGLSMVTSFYKEAGGGKRPIRWLAPESIARYEYSIKSDVFAFGVLMWETFTNGKQPFSDMTNQAIANAVVKNGMRLMPPNDMPYTTAQLMKACFITNPQQRPSFLTLKERLRREHENMSKGKKGMGIIGLGWLKKKK